MSLLNQLFLIKLAWNNWDYPLTGFRSITGYTLLAWPICTLVGEKQLSPRERPFVTCKKTINDRLSKKCSVYRHCVHQNVIIQKRAIIIKWHVVPLRARTVVKLGSKPTSIKARLEIPVTFPHLSWVTITMVTDIIEGGRPTAMPSSTL